MIFQTINLVELNNVFVTIRFERYRGYKVRVWED